MINQPGRAEPTNASPIDDAAGLTVDEAIVTAAHGVSPQVQAQWARQADRDRSETFFEALGGERMCRVLAREVFECAERQGLTSLPHQAEIPLWQQCVYNRLLSYWGSPFHADALIALTDGASLSPADQRSSADTTAWRACVWAAVDHLDLAPPLRQTLAAYFRQAVHAALAELCQPTGQRSLRLSPPRSSYGPANAPHDEHLPRQGG